jgi:hypothetical protein
MFLRHNADQAMLQNKLALPSANPTTHGQIRNTSIMARVVRFATLSLEILPQNDLDSVIWRPSAPGTRVAFMFPVV